MSIDGHKPLMKRMIRLNIGAGATRKHPPVEILPSPLKPQRRVLIYHYGQRFGYITYISSFNSHSFIY